MAFIDSDIVIALQNSDGTNLDDYDTAPYSFVTDRLYVLFITGTDSTFTSSANAIGTPSTTNITWNLEETSEVNTDAMTVYTGTIASASSEIVNITYPEVQGRSKWLMLEIANANATIVQVNENSWDATSGSIILAGTIATDGLAISAFTRRAWTASNFTTGTGEVAITGTSNQTIYAQYNIIEDETLDVGTPDDSVYLGTGLEIAYALSATPAITNINGGSTIADGETGVTIAVTGASAPNTVTISLVDDVNDASATVQVITDESTSTAIDITVSLPTGYDVNDPVYVFVENSSALVSNSMAVSITVSVSTFHTLHIVDDNPATVNVSAGLTTGSFYEILDPGDTVWTTIGAANGLAGTRFDATGAGSGTGTAYALTDVICSTVLGFDAGIIAAVYRAATPSTPEYATSITSLSNLDTATIQLMVTYPNGAPVSGDFMSFTYSSAPGAGDIISVTGSVALATSTLTTNETEVC